MPQRIRGKFKTDGWPMKIALIQFNASDNKNDNIRRIKEFVHTAALQGAVWILLPENFSFRGSLLNREVLAQTQEPVGGPTTEIFQELAKELKANILLGSLLEQSATGKPCNTSVAINKEGKVIAKYRKIHLFDAIVDGKIIKEADFLSHGKHGEIISVEEFKVGLSVCYDLRFPDLYQTYSRQGAQVLTVPSCFTKKTGQAHWESLLRARAIENLAYVLAPNQIGVDSRGMESYGNSMVVSPWGEIIAQGSSREEEIIYADISMEKIKEARTKLPGIVK